MRKKQQWVKRENTTLSKNFTKMSVFSALRWCDQNIWIVLLLNEILPKPTDSLLFGRRNVLVCWILFNIQNICHIRGANATTNINHPAKKKHICCQPQRTFVAKLIWHKINQKVYSFWSLDLTTVNMFVSLNLPESNSPEKYRKSLWHHKISFSKNFVRSAHSVPKSA